METIWVEFINVTKTGVPILGIMILFMKAHTCVSIVMQIGLKI
jgi:hypothetical protein